MSGATAMINQEVYDQLGERWYSAKDDPVALLRAESRLRMPWIGSRLREAFGPGRHEVLDLACGAGFLSNALARSGYGVTGVDLSDESLEVARRHDVTGSVRYLAMDAHRLKFPDQRFSAVCAMDFLEHTERPGEVVREAARVLKPGGLFFFHTFNRNWLSRLVVIRGVEWFVRNVPENLHVYPLFVKPAELRRYCSRAGLRIRELRGVQPRVSSRPFWRMLATGRVSDQFEFRFCKSLLTGYCGIARKK